MLLPWLTVYRGVPGPDVETHYYPTETGGNAGEYDVSGTGNRYEFRASDDPQRVEYRALPTRR